MGASATQPVNLKTIFSQSRRIVKSHRRVFLGLSLLFLLPLSAITVLYSTLHSGGDDPSPVKTNIILALAIFFFSLVFTPCAAGSITYAAFHAFNDEPVKLKAAIKSISASFFPLLATTLLLQSIIFAAALIFALVVISSVKIAGALYFLVFFAVIFIVLMIYIQVNWSLIYPIVVVESRWGFDALKQSKALIKGKRGVALSLQLILMVIFYLLFFPLNRVTDSTIGISSGDDWWKCLLVISAWMLFKTGFLALIQLYSAVATTVLYAYSAAGNHGRQDVSGEYFSLPIDDEKVALVV